MLFRQFGRLGHRRGAKDTEELDRFPHLRASSCEKVSIVNVHPHATCFGTSHATHELQSPSAIVLTHGCYDLPDTIHFRRDQLTPNRSGNGRDARHKGGEVFGVQRLGAVGLGAVGVGVDFDN